MNEQSKKQQILTVKHEAWRRGSLVWKLDQTQKGLYNLFYNSNHKIMTWLLSRRQGKTYTLCILALEQCIKYPNSIVKFISPTKIQVNNNARPVFRQILEDCPDDIKPEFRAKDYIYFFPNGSEIQLAGSDAGHAEKLRGGDCLEKGTLIMTPTGPKPIESFQIDDEVYGYNLDGSISITKVTNLFNNGLKQVRNVFKEGKKIFACTDNHHFLTITNSSWDRNKLENIQERPLKDIKKYTRFYRHNIDIPCGSVEEKDAYIIGAFIGDGCSTNTIGYQLHFSEYGENIISFMADHLKCRFEKSGINRYSLKNNTSKHKHGTELTFNYYKEWLKGKSFLNKNFDWDIVNTWNRSSCLKLLAGLIDTDGNIYPGKESLDISYTSCNKDLITNISKLLFKLYQIEPNFKYRDKENHHRQYTITVKNNFYSKKILKELSPYLILNRKKWKDNYELYSTSTNEKTQFLTISDEYFEAETFDLSVGNNSHLYLLADGTVTHNSHIWFIDEAGSCNDLNNIIKSILLPTTLITNGKGVLASTPPKEADHEFLKWIEDCQMKGSLVKKTIDDNPRITGEQRSNLIEELGGINTEEARRELFCEIIKDSTTSVIPEFDEVMSKEIVKEWPRPPFFDGYEGMDTGGKDFTVVVFGYYDFRAAKIIIEDEAVMDFRNKDETILSLVKKINEKEKKLFCNPISGEFTAPYKRVSDVNYILTQEIYNHSKQILPKDEVINFEIIQKDLNEAMINNLRILINNKKIIINPRCTTLIRHLMNARWDKQKKKFARSADDGHYDGVEALKYLVRCVDFKKNPYPSHYQLNTQALFVRDPEKFNNNSNNQIDVFKRLFGVKSKGK